MKLAEFDYYLPKELIAQEPISPRDSSNLLILDKATGDIKHSKFFEIIDYLSTNDVLVFNDTKVIPARLIGKKRDTLGKQEVLLIRPDKQNDNNLWPSQWLVIGSPAMKTNQIVTFGNDLEAKVIEVRNSERVINFNKQGQDLKEAVFKIGQMPLPPYIKNPTHKSFNEYQTIYAQKEGSIAAPTAGFHFTQDLIDKITNKGVNIEYLTLHVGLGTFMPVKTGDIENHVMHSEYYEINQDTATRLNQYKKEHKRIISVGTTSCRVLESCADEKGYLKPQKGWTDIFIYPGYKFKFIDALITNFHLPKSTLLMLVSAFASKDLILKAYQEAIGRHYRFYSFGDAMLIQ